MKTLIFIVPILITQVFFAQEYPLFNNLDYGKVPGAYYKDLDNDLNNYVGTWQYNNGTNVLIIKLEKRTHVFREYNNLYTDFLIGEYQYIENGVEKVNTLANIEVSYPSVYSYNIVGNVLNKASHIPACDECNPEQRRAILKFSDPTRSEIEGLSGRIVLRRVDSGGIQKIEMWLRQAGHITYISGNPPAYDSLNVPWGKYVLTKVN